MPGCVLAREHIGHGSPALLGRAGEDAGIRTDEEVMMEEQSKPQRGGSLLDVGRRFVEAWNRHDPKGLAALWSTHGDFVSPFGRAAKGRDEIEAAFADEHATIFRDTTYSSTVRRVQMVDPNVVVATWDGLVTGLKNPDGSALPDFHHIVTVVAVRKGDQWQLATVRPMVPAPLPDWVPAKVGGGTPWVPRAT